MSIYSIILAVVIIFLWVKVLAENNELEQTNQALKTENDKYLKRFGNIDTILQYDNDKFGSVTCDTKFVVSDDSEGSDIVNTFVSTSDLDVRISKAGKMGYKDENDNPVKGDVLILNGEIFKIVLNGQTIYPWENESAILSTTEIENMTEWL